MQVPKRVKQELIHNSNGFCETCHSERELTVFFTKFKNTYKEIDRNEYQIVCRKCFGNMLEIRDSVSRLISDSTYTTNQDYLDALSHLVSIAEVMQNEIDSFREVKSYANFFEKILEKVMEA